LLPGLLVMAVVVVRRARGVAVLGFVGLAGSAASAVLQMLSPL
jgi:hypothetical protein